MRDRLRQHFPTVAALASTLALAAAVSLLAGTPAGLAYAGGPAVPRTPLAMPDPADDRDRDSYADAVDRTDGNLLVAVRLLELDVAADAHPYVLAGTQDDHARTGLGAELQWRHVVDHDPLGRRPGSPGWQADALRTGSWVSTTPGAGLARSVAETGNLAGDAPDGAAWPQTLLLDVRDDRAALAVEVEAWNARGSPDPLLGRWRLDIDLETGTWTAEGGAAIALGQAADLRAGDGGARRLRIAVATEVDLAHEVKEELAEHWAPTVRFADGERFFPVPGAALQRFHGFYQRPPDLRTWEPSFNNGRDTYRFLLADIDGDGRADFRDVALLTDILAVGDVASPTLHAHVARAGAEAVVVQYWFLYFYGFVLGADGRPVDSLAHAGDRELIQLTFRDLAAARNGTPDSVVFGHHYGGLRVTDPADLGIDGPGWDAYVARGSHALYPVAGDDRRIRPALSGYGDLFDGDGQVWLPGDYTVDVLAAQEWHAGTLWGPVTRFSRDLGTSARPLLQHDFRYPFTEPLWWEATMPAYTAAEARDLLGAPA